MKIITTDYENKKFWEETEKESALMGDCMHVVNICPDVTYIRKKKSSLQRDVWNTPVLQIPEKSIRQKCMHMIFWET